MVFKDNWSSPELSQVSALKPSPSASTITILQIKLRHSKAASILLMKTVTDNNVDVVLIQEPYAIKKATVELPNVPPGFTAYHRLGDDFQYGSAILVKSSVESKMLEKKTNNQVTCVQIFSGKEAVLLMSAYCRPSTQGVGTVISQPFKHHSRLLPRALIALDSNAKNVLWNSRRTDDKGSELENLALLSGLSFANRRKEELSFVPGGTSFVDVTLIGSETEVANWRYLEDHSLSDHPYIIMELIHAIITKNKGLTTERKTPRIEEIDKNKFKTSLPCQIESVGLKLSPTTEEEVDQFAEKINAAIISAACLSKEKRVREQGIKAPWWSKKLEILRTSTRRAFKRWSATKTEEAKEKLKKLRKEYRREMRRASSEHFKEFCIKNMNEDLLSCPKGNQQ